MPSLMRLFIVTSGVKDYLQPLDHRGLEGRFLRCAFTAEGDAESSQFVQLDRSAEQHVGGHLLKEIAQYVLDVALL